MQSTSIRVLGLALALLTFSCGEADKVENKITCASVCNRYKDCFDSDYDVGNCTDSCEAEANSNNDKDRRLEECDTCIDGQSCTGAAFSCATECAGIIAQ
jgi:hypothetical protein